MTNIGTALEQAEKLQLHSGLEREILLCHLLQKNRAYLFAHPEALLTPTQTKAYLQLIKQRVQGVPIAYLTHSREFWSLPLRVNQHTLIPRHETERLVEIALDKISNKPGTQVLDLGTGSGALAVALARERPHWHMVACDKDAKALEIAKENAQNLGIKNISFYHSHWFSQLPAIHYEAIISNPPYLAKDDPHLQQGDLRFEPLNALVSGQDGLADLQYIIEQSDRYLLPKGLLLLEHGCDQRMAVHTILKAKRYKNIQCWQDLQGHDRVSGGSIDS